MHNVEMIRDGQMSGWIGGQPDGCPSQVRLSMSDQAVEVFAIRTREDVHRAGHTLYCGVKLRVSAGFKGHVCKVAIEDKLYEITPTFKSDPDIVRVDEVEADLISGWIKRTESIRSLCFYSADGMARAEIHRRSDVNKHLKTPKHRLHGFRVHGVNVAGLYAIKLNNEFVHWVRPGWLTRNPT